MHLRRVRPRLSPPLRTSLHSVSEYLSRTEEEASAEFEEPRLLPASFQETETSDSSPSDTTSQTAKSDETPESASPNPKTSDSETTDTEQCCGYSRVWARAEYFFWWTDGMRAPPLVTTSPDGTGQDQAGVLGQVGTSILYGNERFNSSSQSGGRFTLGYWLDPCLCDGVEATYLMVAQQSDSFSASSDDYSILARPFYNTVDGQEDARLIGYPGLVEGLINVTAITDFQGAEVLFRRSMTRSCWSAFDLLAGYRWAQLEDNLLIEESTDALSGATAGTTFDLYDEFDTRNNFHGVELGMRMRRQFAPCWSVELLGKVALGNVNSAATIAGQTLATDATGGTSLTEGGLLALPTNIGRYEQNSLATISEVGLVLRREFHCGLHATVGYTLIHLSDVARAGNHVDPYINVSQLPPGSLTGMPRPEFSFTTTGFWAQGLSLGLEYKF